MDSPTSWNPGSILTARTVSWLDCPVQSRQVASNAYVRNRLPTFLDYPGFRWCQKRTPLFFWGRSRLFVYSRQQQTPQPYWTTWRPLHIWQNIHPHSLKGIHFEQNYIIAIMLQRARSHKLVYSGRRCKRITKRLAYVLQAKPMQGSLFLTHYSKMDWGRTPWLDGSIDRAPVHLS